MNLATVLEFRSLERSGGLEFTDLEKRLERFLGKPQTLPDLDEAIDSINQLLKGDQFTDLEKKQLRRMRQRMYDRKRNSKYLTNPDPDRSGNMELQTQIYKSRPSKPVSLNFIDSRKKNYEKGISMNLGETQQINKKASFFDSIKESINDIDGKSIIGCAPGICFWFMVSAIASWFIWQQSVGLYEAVGFSDSVYAATGGLFLVVGASAFYATSKSRLALMLCIYASCYEGYLMISGSIEDEKILQISAVKMDADLAFLQEKSERELGNYNRQERRYKNPNSEVFENAWFKKNFLDPAWGARAKAHEAYMAKKSQLISKSTNKQAWLKIFYRLGLVFLCMLFVHRFFRSVVELTDNLREKSRTA